jgi:hypothetical protein
MLFASFGEELEISPVDLLFRIVAAAVVTYFIIKA